MDKLSIWIPVIVAIITSIVPAIATIVTVLITNNKTKSNQKEVLRIIMRGDMYNIALAVKQKGYRTDKSDEIFLHTWEAYDKLGGNSWGEGIKADYFSVKKK